MKLRYTSRGILVVGDTGLQVIPEDIVQRCHLLHSVEMLTERAVVLLVNGSLELFIRQAHDDHFILLEGLYELVVGRWQ